MKKCVLAVNSFPEFIPNLKRVINSILPSAGWDIFVITNCGFRHEDDRIVVKDLNFEFWNQAFYWFLNENNYDVISFLDDDDIFSINKLRRMDQLLEKYIFIHNFARYSNPAYNYNAISNNTSCMTVRTDYINEDMFKNTRYLNDMLIYLNFVGKRGGINLAEFLTYIRFKHVTGFEEFKKYLENRYNGRMEDLNRIYAEFSLDKSQESIIRSEVEKYRFMFKDYATKDIFRGLISFDRHVYKALLDRKRGLDYFILQEYNKRYGRDK